MIGTSLVGEQANITAATITATDQQRLLQMISNDYCNRSATISATDQQGDGPFWWYVDLALPTMLPA